MVEVFRFEELRFRSKPQEPQLHQKSDQKISYCRTEHVNTKELIMQQLGFIGGSSGVENEEANDWDSVI